MDRLVRVRIAPMKEFHPSVTGKEWRRARSRGRRGFGARRAWTLERIRASSGVLVGGGSGTYGRRIVAGCVVVVVLSI